MDKYGDVSPLGWVSNSHLHAFLERQLPSHEGNYTPGKAAGLLQGSQPSHEACSFSGKPATGGLLSSQEGQGGGTESKIVKCSTYSNTLKINVIE